MQRADAEKRGASLARQRAGAAERVKSRFPGRVALQRIELRRDAEAPPERRLERWASDGATTSAHSTPSTIRRCGDRQVGQGDQPFEDRSPSRARCARFAGSARNPARRVLVKIVASIGPAVRPVGAQWHEARRVKAADVVVAGARARVATSLARLSRTCAASRRAGAKPPAAQALSGRNDVRRP